MIHSTDPAAGGQKILKLLFQLFSFGNRDPPLASAVELQVKIELKVRTRLAQRKLYLCGAGRFGEVPDAQRALIDRRKQQFRQRGFLTLKQISTGRAIIDAGDHRSNMIELAGAIELAGDQE